MRPLVLFILAGAVLAQAPSAPPPSAEAPPSPAIKSVGTMSEIMLEMVYPTSTELFYAGRNETKTAKDWIDLRENALVMAESANLLMADNRARDKGQWMTDAKLLRDVGDKAYAAAKAKDLPAILALNADLYEACQACHEHYRPGYRRRL